MRISLSKAQHLLETGHLVALPTETVYGLGALLKYPQAIDAIFTLKGRPNNNPLIIHLAAVETMAPWVEELPEQIGQLAETFWPGPMTLVLKVKPEFVPERARAGLPTAAFRIPSQPQTLELLAKCGPLVMPSANLSGRPSATSAQHVEEDFGFSFPIVDGGACQKGLESTILMHDGQKWVIIRLGALQPEVFVPVLGYLPPIQHAQKGAIPLCPGQHYRHYSPKAKLTLSSQFSADSKGIVLGFSDAAYPPGCHVKILGSLKQPEIVAENLYSVLRQLDEQKIHYALVDMRFPREGLWLTIAERLTRASVFQEVRQLP